MNSIEGLFCFHKQNKPFFSKNSDRREKKIERQNRGKITSLQVYLIEGKEKAKEEKEREQEYFNGFVDTLTLLIKKYGNQVLKK